MVIFILNNKTYDSIILINDNSKTVMWILLVKLKKIKFIHFNFFNYFDCFSNILIKIYQIDIMCLIPIIIKALTLAKFFR